MVSPSRGQPVMRRLYPRKGPRNHLGPRRDHLSRVIHSRPAPDMVEDGPTHLHRRYAMRWTVACPVVALLLAGSLAACGDGEGPGAGGPTRSPTVELPSPTRTGASEDTDQPEPSR